MRLPTSSVSRIASSTVSRIASSSAPVLLAALLASQPLLPLLPLPVLTALPAVARNLPESNGASGAARGTTGALVPIVRLETNLAAAQAALPNLKACTAALDSGVPAAEREFKRIFDEFSEGISYKQQYRDKNAFLVYYTQGFDGAGRPSIETESSTEVKQREQFGARNEAWIGVDDARAEVAFLATHPPADDGDLKELRDALRRALSATAAYLEQAPPELVAEARQLARAPG